jgi:hypothetical protein
MQDRKKLLAIKTSSSLTLHNQCCFQIKIHMQISRVHRLMFETFISAKLRLDLQIGRGIF